MAALSKSKLKKVKSYMVWLAWVSGKGVGENGKREGAAESAESVSVCFIDSSYSTPLDGVVFF